MTPYPRVTYHTVLKVTTSDSTDCVLPSLSRVSLYLLRLFHLSGSPEIFWSHVCVYSANLVLFGLHWIK
jgi:hypothetical protein